MDNNYLGIKELYDVSLRCDLPLTINGVEYAKNETILKFDRIQFAPLIEYKVRASSNGGYGNAELINWENTTSVDFTMSEGVISRTGFAILSNSQLDKNNNSVLINFSEKLEINEDGKVNLKYKPILDNNTFFIYYEDTNKKVEEQSYLINENEIIFTNEEDFYKNIIVDYVFEYTRKQSILSVGKRLLNGYFKIDGKFKAVDDQDGLIKTGIIEIPKVELMSDLTMRLGQDSNLYTYRFQFKGLPVGARGNQYVCRIILLDNEIDSDL